MNWPTGHASRHAVEEVALVPAVVLPLAHVVQASVPVESAYDPFAQPSQGSTVVLLKVPIGHKSKHKDVSLAPEAAVLLPTVQSVHELRMADPVAYLPWAQLVQDVTANPG